MSTNPYKHRLFEQTVDADAQNDNSSRANSYRVLFGFQRKPEQEGAVSKASTVLDAIRCGPSLTCSSLISKNMPISVVNLETFNRLTID